MSNTNTPFVSVIIPVFNDSERLTLCLRALEQQTYPKDAYEIIVVDNNSTEAIAPVVQPFHQARLIDEQKQGSYAARNTGIAVAKGSIFGFTDSDCIPEPDWIEQGVKQILKTPNCGLIAGQIKLTFQRSNRPTPTELYDHLNFLQQQHYVQYKHYGATANLFTYKSVFEAVGLFDAELKSGGDKEWGNRVFAAGYTQVYAEEVCIAHPARSDLKELTKKIGRITEGHFLIDNYVQRSWIHFLGELYWDFKPPIKELLKILTSSNLTGIGQKLAYSSIFLYLRWVKACKKLELYLKHRANHQVEQDNLAKC